MAADRAITKVAGAVLPKEPPRFILSKSDVRFEIAFTPLLARLRGLSLYEAAPEPGRKAVGLLEVARHMALIGETGVRRCIGVSISVEG